MTTAPAPGGTKAITLFPLSPTLPTVHTAVASQDPGTAPASSRVPGREPMAPPNKAPPWPVPCPGGALAWGHRQEQKASVGKAPPEPARPRRQVLSLTAVLTQVPPERQTSNSFFFLALPEEGDSTPGSSLLTGSDTPRAGLWQYWGQNPGCTPKSPLPSPQAPAQAGSHLAPGRGTACSQKSHSLRG